MNSPDRHHSRSLPSVLTDRRGNALLEFSLVMPVMFVFTLVLFEFGMMIFGTTLIKNASSQMARSSMIGCEDNNFITTGVCQPDSIVSPQSLRRLITDKTAGFIDACDPARFRITANPINAVTFNNPQGGGGVNLGQGGEVIVFTAEYDWPVFSPVFAVLGVFDDYSIPNIQVNPDNTITFTTVTMVRNEPFGTLPAGARNQDGAC